MGDGKEEREDMSFPFVSSFPSPLAHPLVTLLAFPSPRVIQIQTTGDESGTDSIVDFTRLTVNVDKVIFYSFSLLDKTCNSRRVSFLQDK